MARDIEEFLKMAAQRRQQQRQKSSRGNAAPTTNKPPPADASRRVSTTSRPPLNQQTSADPIIVLDSKDRVSTQTDPYNQSISEYVQSHMDTTDVTEQAEQLGDEVALADDKMDARLQSTFDHQIGSLKSAASDSAFATTTTATAQRVSPIADELLDMLSSPKSIRQAILLNEILQRPKFD
ncbi:MAG: hypothetical protein GY743_17925 [Planctomycetaceae bacterium]|nr:hypothetical protein [Planctomycetaceae bacterium]